MSWISARDSERQKLEGALLTVCTDCKDMVLQVCDYDLFALHHVMRFLSVHHVANKDQVSSAVINLINEKDIDVNFTLTPLLSLPNR